MVGNANGKKYTMIVFEEDERYGSNGIQLGFYSDNPWEGNLSDIVEGDKTVVYAVKTGKEAAGAIHHYLEGACSC